MDVSRFYGILGGLALVGVRVAGALLSPIADCDETFNYWEPVHYLVYGTGMQTWEYAPAYTLRSYAYLLPHAAVGKLLDVVLQLIQGHVPDKRLVFYGLRVLLGLVSAACEATFVDGVTRRLGPRPGLLTFALLLTSAGVFQASPALLPSSAAANLVMVTTANWLTHRNWWATFFAVLAVLALGWPFVALLFVPLAAHVLYDCVYVSAGAGPVPQWRRGGLRVLGYGVGAVALVLPVVLAIDAFFYQRLAFPAWNILRYNVGGGPEGAGDNLYGVEPWWWYLLNLGANLGVVLPLALLFPFALLGLSWPNWSSRAKAEALVFVSPAFLWLGVMTSRPHKEERFLFPIYPLLALCAALTLHGLVAALAQFAEEKEGNKKTSSSSSSAAAGTPRARRQRTTTTTTSTPSPSPTHLPSFLLRTARRLAGLAAATAVPLTLLLHTLLSLSRIVSMVHNYSAPIDLFREFSGEQRAAHLAHVESGTSCTHVRLCLGSDWYRFPSSFFLPHQGGISLAFVREEGEEPSQLPQPFRADGGTWKPPLQPFNQHNREEPSRYVPIHSCRYLVKVFPPPQAKEQKTHDQQKETSNNKRKKKKKEKSGGTDPPPHEETEDEEIVHNIQWLDSHLRHLGESRPVAWKVLRHYPLLDMKTSPTPWRALWVPGVSHHKVHYGAFALLEREEEEDFDPGAQWAELGFMQ